MRGQIPLRQAAGSGGGGLDGLDRVSGDGRTDTLGGSRRRDLLSIGRNDHAQLVRTDGELSVDVMDLAFDPLAIDDVDVGAGKREGTDE